MADEKDRDEQRKKLIELLAGLLEGKVEMHIINLRDEGRHLSNELRPQWNEAIKWLADNEHDRSVEHAIETAFPFFKGRGGEIYKYAAYTASQLLFQGPFKGIREEIQFKICDEFMAFLTVFLQFVAWKIRKETEAANKQ